MPKKHVLLCFAFFGLLVLPSLCFSFSQADFAKLKATNECNNCDLSEADLSGKNLSKAKLEGADLSRANLTNTVLRMADLDGAIFKNADLTHTVLEAADLHGANFEGANLDGTIFDGAYLVNAVFEAQGSLAAVESKEPVMADEKPVIKEKPSESEITNVDEGIIEDPVGLAAGPEVDQLLKTQPSQEKDLPAPIKTIDPRQRINTLLEVYVDDPFKFEPDPALNIAGFKPLPEDTSDNEKQGKAVFPMSKDDLLDRVDDTQMCAGCDFSGMELTKVKFKGVYLEKGNFEGADLSEANLKMANLKGANLRNANLSGADLREADLYMADLTGANLSNADLEDALIAGAQLTGANFEGTLVNPEVK